MKAARTVRLASIVALAGAAAPVNAQTAYTWGAPAGGLWDDSLSWSPSTGFPDLDDGASITGVGEINLTLGGSDLNDACIRVPAGSATIGAAQTITGSGRLTGDITMHGVIAPGASAGQINHNSGSLTLSSTSVMEIELSAADGASHDRITGNADHALSGSLVVSEIDGYIPVVGDSFVIVDGASFTGKFDSETFPSTLPNRVYRVFYEADHVLLVHTCTSDFAPPYDVLDFPTPSPFSPRSAPAAPDV